MNLIFEPKLRVVRRLFNSNLVPREINRANQRKWVRAVRELGDKWQLARPKQD
jgi:hypothetical protein